MSRFVPPPALRLIRAPGARGAAPKPPFGLGSFAGDSAATAGADVGMALEVEPGDTVQSLLARLPRAETLPHATPIVLFVGKSGLGASVARLFGKTATVPRAVRATALLAHGFREIEATVDEGTGQDLVTAIA